MPATDERVAQLAPDLNTGFPRSPRERLGGFVVAARTLDKCRAKLAGTLGEYHFDCPLDNFFFDFTGITAADFEQQVATGADDAAMAEWIKAKARTDDTNEIVQWNNDMRYKRLCEMPIKLQVFLEEYIPKYVPQHQPVYYWFDVYDLEQTRL